MLVSNVGTWMQRVAQDWLVLVTLDGGPAALGITTGLQFLPFLVVAPFGGALADRLPKRRLLIFSNGFMGLVALISRHSGCYRHGPGVARLRAGVLAGCWWSTRQPGSEDVRRRTGRARRRTERSWPEQRVVSYCTVGGAGGCRAAHCSSGARPGLPAQRADIRRADSPAADDRTGRRRNLRTGPNRPEPSGRRSVRVRASGCSSWCSRSCSSSARSA